MLRTNLSTRPFYNEQVVRVLIGIVGLLLATIFVFDLQQGLVLSRRLAAARREANADDQRAAAMRARAAQLRTSIQPAELQAVQAAANEANAMIDRRAFSWTELLNHIEATLPRGVMLTAIRPSIEEGTIKVTMAVIGRTVTDIDTFMEALERTGAFADLLSTEEQTIEEGSLRATLVGRYVPADGRRAGAGAPREAEARPASAGSR